ncbi:hypothetical protein PFISCL1PPCAC_10063 [Pristionchus fissidentatus]|uniref:Palmitoyltransferase n=1 Tax=Pristionchus fissidentatus TaxID=1538716 RepID=A0AAV5VGI8_9BILA|nr:hypothetical protein PFISCL1PPCAC_10063 [Pristionchus fissidentatus]
MCKKISQLLPAGVAWFLLVGSTAFFYALLAPRLMQDDMWGIRAYFVIGIDVVLFLLVVSNLVMAMCLDPGIHPIATLSEEQNGGDEFRSPLYKNVVINGISVRMKWCVTCKFYRPPRASHCSVCNRCIDNFDHHCPWVHNCVGWRNYRYFFFFLVFLSLHMVYVGTTCIVYLLQNAKMAGETMDPPFLCSVALLILTIVLCIPVIGLTIFHVILVVRGRSTNEQVTGKFQSGFNPFTRGWYHNCFFTLCHSQSPSFVNYSSSRYTKKAEQRQKRTLKVLVTDETSVLYVPDGEGKEGGHIRLKQMRGGDSDSVGTALSLGKSMKEEKSVTANGSTCNLYEEKNTSVGAYEASLAEAMAGSSLSAGSPSSERIALLNNGDRRGKPLAFSDAMRIHDELSSPTRAVNL